MRCRSCRPATIPFRSAPAMNASASARSISAARIARCARGIATSDGIAGARCSSPPSRSAAAGRARRTPITIRPTRATNGRSSTADCAADAPLATTASQPATTGASATRSAPARPTDARTHAQRRRPARPSPQGGGRSNPYRLGPLTAPGAIWGGPRISDRGSTS